MDKRAPNKNHAEAETQWVNASQWISRTLAVTLVMVIPGILGSMLDRRLGTQQFAVIGFAVGFLMGTTGLIVLARKLTPPARGKPLEWEDAATTDPSENGQDGAKERENSLRDPEN